MIQPHTFESSHLGEVPKSLNTRLLCSPSQSHWVPCKRYFVFPTLIKIIQVLETFPYLGPKLQTRDSANTLKGRHRGQRQFCKMPGHVFMSSTALHYRKEAEQESTGKYRRQEPEGNRKYRITRALKGTILPDTQWIPTCGCELTKDTVFANDREANIQCDHRVEKHRLAHLPQVK